MLFFNLGKYEILIIVIVGLFFVVLPLVSWFMERRRQARERELP